MPLKSRTCFTYFVRRYLLVPLKSGTHSCFSECRNPSSIMGFLRNPKGMYSLATCLAALHEVAHLLVQEHWVYHCKLINSRQPDPHTYSVGDIVFALHAVQSDAAKGSVGKLQYTFTGLWKVTAALKDASYELEHCSIPSRKEKKTRF